MECPSQLSETEIACCGGSIPTAAHCGSGRNQGLKTDFRDMLSLTEQHEHVTGCHGARAAGNAGDDMKIRCGCANHDRRRKTVNRAEFALDSIAAGAQKQAKVFPPPTVAGIAQKEGVEQLVTTNPPGATRPANFRNR